MQKSKIRKEYFQRVLCCLAHPIVLLSMLLLFLNDFCFRIFFPSWLTGKLGDFTWLLFFPFLLATVLVWIVPMRLLRKPNVLILIATAISGVVFTLGKTWPLFHQGLIAFVEWLFGWPVGWVLDPSDLIALVSLPVCTLLWHKVQTKPVMKPLKIEWRWVLLPVAALLVMADSAEMNTGLTCSDVVDNELYVRSSWGTYKALSGGMEWELVSVYDDVSIFDNGGCDTFAVYNLTEAELASFVFQVIDPADKSSIFRVIPGEVIEYSGDGGKTWRDDYQIQPTAEAELLLYQRIAERGHAGSDRFQWPFDADFDPVSGNLIFPMGFMGVLVRESDGTYHRVTVENYEPHILDFSQILSMLFPGEYMLSITLGIISSAIFLFFTKKFRFYQGLMIVFGLIIFYVGISWPSVERWLSGSFSLNLLILLLGLILLVILLLIAAIFYAKRKGFVLLTGLVSSLFFFLPFIGWGFNILPHYQLAFGVGILLSGGWTYYRYRRLNLKDIADETKQ